MFVWKIKYKYAGGVAVKKTKTLWIFGIIPIFISISPV